MPRAREERGGRTNNQDQGKIGCAEVRVRKHVVRRRQKMGHKEHGNTVGKMPSLRKMSGEGDIWIYTDGSYKVEKGRNEEVVGKATWAVVSDDGETFAGPIINGTVGKNHGDESGEESTFQVETLNNNLAELMALLMAARYLKGKEYSGSAVVWTDSAWAVQHASGLTQIQPQTDDEIQDLIRMVRSLFYEIKKRKRVEIKWVKGHDGDEGNEMADKCAEMVQKWPALMSFPYWGTRKIGNDIA